MTHRIHKRPMDDSSDEETTEIEEKEDEKYVEQTNQMSTANVYNKKMPQIKANELRPNPNKMPSKNKIGSGKFGNVYESWYDKHIVAVKEYKNTDDYLHETNVIEHINNFSVLSDHIKYANILKPIGVCNEFVLWEYMSGGSADKLLANLLYSNHSNGRKKNKKKQSNVRNILYILDILDILIDVCNGMKCLHSMGIIHRDLAARNLLFEPNDTYILKNSKKITKKKNDKKNNKKYKKKYNVKICDFGECVINENKTQSRKGPYLWLAPESIRKQICNKKTDIYSFGILCYELIVGVRPLPVHETPIEIAVMEILLLSQRPNITSYYKLIPLQLFILIQLCWQQIAEYRPNDFGEILSILSELRKHIIKNKKNSNINTRLNKIKFNKNKSKEILKDLSYLISQYLSDDNDMLMNAVNKQEIMFKKNKRYELLKKIINYNYKLNKATDIEAINFYVNNFPWGESKNVKKHEKKRDEAIDNVNQYAKTYDMQYSFSK